MVNRKVSFAVGEYYHCYNRGVDNREIFSDRHDFVYFLKALRYFNHEESLGDMSAYFDLDETHRHSGIERTPIVTIHAYCLNLNHFHLLLSQLTEDGISRFMQRLGTGYTLFYNQKYERSGALFQGTFKSSHIDSDQYLRRIGAYISLNNHVHGIVDKNKFRSSYASLMAAQELPTPANHTLMHELYGKKNIEKEMRQELLETIVYRKTLEKPERSAFLE